MAPLIVGLVASALGTKDEILPTVIKIAALIGGLQVVVFLWSVVSTWVERNAYALDSASANKAISLKFNELAETPTDDRKEFDRRISMLEAEDSVRRQFDEQQDISDKELRMGMRAALRQFKRECSACGLIPTSMTPSSCDVCGTFGHNFIKR